MWGGQGRSSAKGGQRRFLLHLKMKGMSIGIFPLLGVKILSLGRGSPVVVSGVQGGGRCGVRCGAHPVTFPAAASSADSTAPPGGQLFL